ncbi:hypothetical protein ciss_07320 [Carboxydothermus islandicus]|uniref:ATP-dependent Clp protease proteolytic subunit n=1 Tax=Carboxydothermus islandicus TaxID=661089 RepID=A0A1L8D0Y5_9THEO|nr:head maturation protease, ClpP-related [Carboxydothermus islandicus]GAV24799.1 hypothetical protein ciss_07320 [Carboxydothermus islandicus]
MGQQGKKFWQFKAMTTKNEAELLLYGPISETTWLGDEVTPKQFAEDLKALGDITDLTVRINSGGGDVFAAQAIYSILKSHPAKVTVYVDGLAASAASVIAMSGDVVIMPKNAMMMVHNPWTIGIGNSNDFRKLADDLDKIREGMIAAYQTKTNLDREKLIELLDAETWMTADEALEYGFIDQIDEKIQVAASIKGNVLYVNGLDVDLSRFKNKPKVPEMVPETRKEVKNMELTAEILAKEYPDLYAEIRKQAYEEGKEAGIRAERERFKALQELEVPGNEEIQEILNKARYETGQTADDLAMKIVSILKNQRYNLLNNLVQDAAVLKDIEPAPTPIKDEDTERKAFAKKMAIAANKKRGVE